MSRHIGEPVPVETAPDGSPPTCFTYNGVTYQVHAVLSQWHHANRWWEPTGEREMLRWSNRQYWRVETPDQQIFHLYLDLALRPQTLWVLDVIQG